MWCGTTAVDLSGSRADDDATAAALASFPCLATLSLAGCSKLVDAALADAPCLARLACLDASRCFSLSAGALRCTLDAASRPRARLAAAALSHLDLDAWPETPVAEWTETALSDAVARAPRGTGAGLAWGDAGDLLPPPPPPLPVAASLRALALTNCSRLPLSGLTALATAAPFLEALALGGTTLAAPSILAPRRRDRLPSPPSPPHADATPSSLGAAHVGAAIAALAAARGAVAQVGSPGGGVVVGTPPSGSAPRARAGGVLCADTVAVLRAAVERRDGGGGGGGAAAAALAALVRAAPRLAVLEVTFWPPGAAAAAAIAGNVRVWDLTRTADALAAARALATARAAPGADTPGAPPPPLSLVLAAAAACSSASRSTPLHVAAADGDAPRARALLSLGAPRTARDRGGANPVFVAAEAGNVGVLTAVLGGGGLHAAAPSPTPPLDPTAAATRNAAGEAPLYIAALRGHSACVSALLAHFEGAAFDWTDPALYGDAWTPLMAASLAARRCAVDALLAAARPAARAAALAAALNRYGQSALHVAARRGDAGTLRSLLAAGGGAAAAAVDAAGDTAADVARRAGHGEAAALLEDAADEWRRALRRGR